MPPECCGGCHTRLRHFMICRSWRFPRSAAGDVDPDHHTIQGEFDPSQSWVKDEAHFERISLNHVREDGEGQLPYSHEFGENYM
jgi:hypothetical protein